MKEISDESNSSVKSIIQHPYYSIITIVYKNNICKLFHSLNFQLLLIININNNITNNNNNNNINNKAIILNEEIRNCEYMDMDNGLSLVLLHCSRKSGTRISL